MAFAFRTVDKKTWVIDFNFSAIFTVAEKTGVDLLNPGLEVDGVSLSQALLYNPALLTRVIMAMVKPEDMPDDSFLKRIDAATFHAAEVAFWDAYLNFFARAGRGWIATALRKEIEEKRIRGETTNKTLNDLPSTIYLS